MTTSEPAPNPAPTPGAARAKKERGLKYQLKRQAREWALLEAYALHLSGDPVDVVDEELAEEFGGLEEPKVELRDFADALARHAHTEAAALDDVIAPALQNWRIDRLAIIDHILLRLALAELTLHPDTPYRVVLNEYIDIAKDFGSNETPRFVNGVLDNIARRLRPDEATAKNARKPRGSKENRRT